MTNKHDHNWRGCEHKNLQFCKQCKVPYCADCNKEWYEHQNYLPYLNVGGGNGYYNQSPTKLTDNTLNDGHITTCKHEAT